MEIRSGGTHDIFGSVHNQFLVEIEGILIVFSSEHTSTEHIMHGNASAYYVEKRSFVKDLFKGCCKLHIILLPFLLPHIFASPWSNYIIVCGI